MTENIFPVVSLVNSSEREKLVGQKPLLIWMTGLSGSGKTTLGQLLEKKLLEDGYHSFLLDGDSLRNGLNKDLGFSIEDRNENVRRAGEVCKLLIDSGLIVITSFISPLRSQRDDIRAKFSINEFVEVFIKSSLETCENRDVKGLYNKARKGEIKDFTGIGSPYEEPLSSELIVDTEKKSVDEALENLYDFVISKLK